MSQFELVDYLISQKLRQLNLPPISQAERGWSQLLVNKTLNLVWDVKPTSRGELIFDTSSIQAVALTANGKTLTPRPDKKWTILSGFIRFVTSATAGNRQLIVGLTKNGAVFPVTVAEHVYDIYVTSNIAASTTFVGQFGPSNPTAFFNLNLVLAYPIQLSNSPGSPGGTVKSPGLNLSVWDQNNIDGAGDSILLNLLYLEEDI